ncbi:hypothetical protein MPER_00304, partial [Moniliophthora perniciosa FA553]
MHAFIFTFLVLAITTSAAPQRGRGRGGFRGANKGGNAGATNAGAANGNNGNDPLKSLTLDPRVIARGFQNNGLATAGDGSVASLTSSNNFINFCADKNVDITNGKQIQEGS